MKINKLYNNILLKSRNLNLYNNFKIKDSLQNKIILFLILFSFIFNKSKNNIKESQIIFDYIFKRIECDLREIGLGDLTVNKKMKFIINKFYFILIKFDNFFKKTKKKKIEIISSMLILIDKSNNNYEIILKFLYKFAKTIDLLAIDDIYNANF